MDENLSRGYIQLGKARGANDIRFTKGFSHLSPPVDKYDGIYYSLVLAGVGFLLPYNSFIIAVDFYQMQYPGTTIVFDMSLVYVVMAFFAVLVNNLLIETLSLNTRITFGYIVSFVTLLFVAVFEVWFGVFSTNTSYSVNLVAVAVVALGCTVQQSSFYGYTSMLPSRYTQAVMAGESGAGLLVSLNRILTKLLLNDQRVNTLIFFSVSVLIVGMCFVLHQFVRQTDFVQFYLTLCRESKKITLEPTEDAGLMDPADNGEGRNNQYGVLKLQAQSPLENSQSGGHFSFANPVYEPTANSGPTYKVEDVVVRMTGDAATYRKSSSAKPWSTVQKGIKARWEVAQSIWHYMLSISLVYLVTLSLYPGIESEIISCNFGTWMPIIVMTAFNASDLIGKMMASSVYDWWSKTRLLRFAVFRVVLIPPLLMNAAPQEMGLTNMIPEEVIPLLFSMILGISNGIIGSVPMIQAPSKVPEQHRELTGNIMTLSYNFGLTAGSLLSYVFEAMLGPPLKDPCGIGAVPTNATLLQNATTLAALTTLATSSPTTTLATTIFTTHNPASTIASTTAAASIVPTILNTTVNYLF